MEVEKSADKLKISGVAGNKASNRKRKAKTLSQVSKGSFILYFNLSVTSKLERGRWGRQKHTTRFYLYSQLPGD